MTELLCVLVIVCCALALMALEAFIPGISLAGIAGVILIGIAAYLCYVFFGAAAAAFLLVLSGLLSFYIMRLVLRSMKEGKLSKTGLFLSEQTPPPVKTFRLIANAEPGSIGLSKTELRPSGIAEFDRERMHVVSESGFIEKDDRVVVVRIEGSKIVVRKAE